MTPNELSTQLSECRTSLKKYSDELWGATEQALQAAKELRSKEYTILVTTDPKSLGSNEEVRTAKLWSLCQLEQQKLENMEYTQREVKHRVQNLISEMEYLRAQLRILELNIMVT